MSLKTIKALEQAFVNLSHSERGQPVQDNFKSLVWNLFNNWALQFRVNDKTLEIYINEVEFAGSNFGDHIQEHELQKTIGHFYIHRHAKTLNSWATPRMVSFDMTCGNDQAYGTLLVKSVEFNGMIIPTPGLSFQKICEVLGITKETYPVLDGQNLFDEKSAVRFIYKPRDSNEIELNTRKSIAGSGALLRANWGTVKSKFVQVTIEDIETPNVPTAKTEIDARTRYRSLLTRSFERDYESFLFDCLMEGEVTPVEQEKFLQYAFGKDATVVEWKAKVLSHMDEEYSSHDFLRYKNKVLEQFEETNKGTRKLLKKAYSQRFGERLNEEAFVKFFRSSESCYYCKVTISELKELSKKKQIKTKRKYIKGKSLEIDKKDPNGLYELDNIVLCCYWCNNAKTDEYTDVEFLDVAVALRRIWDKRLKA